MELETTGASCGAKSSCLSFVEPLSCTPEGVELGSNSVCLQQFRIQDLVRETSHRHLWVNFCVGGDIALRGSLEEVNRGDLVGVVEANAADDLQC